MSVRYDNVTFLVCLPRSRSAWLTTFLKPCAWTMHDPLKQCESIDELGIKIDELLSHNSDLHIFVADTSAALFFSDIGRRFPDAKYLFVRRSVQDVERSLRNQDQKVGSTIGYADRCFRNAVRLSSARSDLAMMIDYEKIDDRLRNIWRFVGNGNLLSPTYAEKMRATNIQIPFSQQHEETDMRKARKLFSRFRYIDLS